MIPPKTVLFASDDSQDAVNDARAYINRMGLTKDDVRLVQRDKMTLVLSKRELWDERG